MRIFNKKPIFLVRLLLLTPFVFIFISSHVVEAQPVIYNYFYRVYFKDKGENQLSDYYLSDLVSQKAIMRRSKQGIEAPELNDIPVSKEYTDQITETGLILHCRSKWMNTALFKSESLKDLASIRSLPFVSDIRIVRHPSKTNSTYNKFAVPDGTGAVIPPYDKPIDMLNGYPLHLSDYNGEGVSVAVLDAGFLKASSLPSLSELYGRKGISGTYDFILNDENVFGYSDHGTAVLTVLAGKLTNQIMGTAPGADYWLFRTEDVYSEYPVEEDYWIAAAEYADSLGVDIITTSLGYSKFDDPLFNYKFSDLDGNTTFITKAADIASSKGILVIASAGNERTNQWQRIIAPSDGESVLAVGAVDGNGIIAGFSSSGPSYDKRIKPDIVALGVNVPVQTSELFVLRANGTSFSCPVISGLCACLIQAVPEATNNEIIDALHKSSSRYNSPDSLYGYGIPDMVKTLTLLQDKLVNNRGSATSVSPNPVTDYLEIVFINPPGKLSIEIFNTTGILIYRKSYPSFVSRSLKISSLQNLSQGMYIIRLNTGEGTFTHKVIKLTNQL